jgi:hypothetical protein
MVVFIGYYPAFLRNYYDQIEVLANAEKTQLKGHSFPSLDGRAKMKSNFRAAASRGGFNSIVDFKA